MTFESNDDREKYCRYFEGLRSKYISSLVAYTVGFIIEVLMVVLCKNTAVKITAVIASLLLIVQIIVYIVRYIDVASLFNTGFTSKHIDISVNKVTKREVNGVYCTIYLDSLKIKLEKGKKYRAVYLSKTLGHYLVDIEEIKEEQE